MPIAYKQKALSIANLHLCRTYGERCLVIPYVRPPILDVCLPYQKKIAKRAKKYEQRDAFLNIKSGSC